MLAAVLALFAFVVFLGMLDSFRRTGFVPPLRSMLSSAFGGQYWTLMTGLGVTNLGTTFTHSLGIAPASLYARVFIHQAVVTNTAPVGIGTIGTNIITIFSGVGTLVTLDLEVGQQHSLVS